jgi:uncharacterized protein (TIGR02597 family)
MRTTSYLALLLGSFIAVPFAQAQSGTASTVPVGYMTLSFTANTVKTFSVPLKENPVYTGSISTSSSNTLTTTGAGWVSGTYGPFASNPHLVRLISGTSKGRHFRIASSTTDTLTLTTGNVNFASITSAGDTYEIVPVDTFGSLFGSTANSGTLATGVFVNATSSLADRILLRVPSGWLTYYHDGVSWKRQGSSTNQNTTALMPENAYLFGRVIGAPPLNLALLGVVPSTELMTVIPAGTSTFLANGFPVDTTLNGIGLQNDPSWVKSSVASEADSVLLRVASGWLTYYHTGTNWLRQGSSSPQNPNIIAGSGVLIIRKPGTDIVLDQALPYSLN